MLFVLATACAEVTEFDPWRAEAQSAILVDDDDSAGDDDDSAASSCDLSWLSEVEDVSFSAQVRPLFASNCVPCHDPIGLGGMSLATDVAWAQIVEVPALEGGGSLDRVEPGDPRGSYMFRKVAGCEADDLAWGYVPTQMPPPGQQPLSFDERNLLYSWILQGALDN